MALIDVTAENFEETIKEGIVLLDWWASWCGPCRAFAPIFSAAADQHADITFGKIDTEEQEELAGAFGIRSIPTIMVFRDGVLLLSQPGMLPAETLDELIGQVRALDMDEVRREMAAAEGPRIVTTD
jgi:thioredoxin 1